MKQGIWLQIKIKTYRSRKIDLLNAFQKLCSLSTHKGVTSKYYIKSYAPACMHNNVAKPYDKFNLMKNIIFPIFSWAQKYTIKLFKLYFERNKFQGVTIQPPLR